MNERATLGSGVLLLAAAGAAWAGLLAMGDEMPMEATVWIGAWTVMMAAMMLPSASPLVLLYARRSNTADSALVAVGYVLTWGTRIDRGGSRRRALKGGPSWPSGN